MGRLSGFRYRDVTRKLRVFGFEYARQGPGSHEIWQNSVTHRKVTITRHPKDVPEGTLRAILREADVSVDAFLEA
jgi:predicted RNA binding protein YcfA (HicA-like mRNA interferase family)